MLAAASLSLSATAAAAHGSDTWTQHRQRNLLLVKELQRAALQPPPAIFITQREALQEGRGTGRHYENGPQLQDTSSNSRQLASPHAKAVSLTSSTSHAPPPQRTGKEKKMPGGTP